MFAQALTGIQGGQEIAFLRPQMDHCLLKDMNLGSSILILGWLSNTLLIGPGKELLG